MPKKKAAATEVKKKRSEMPRRVQVTDPKGIKSREVAHAIKVAEFTGGRTQ